MAKNRPESVEWIDVAPKRTDFRFSGWLDPPAGRTQGVNCTPSSTRVDLYGPGHPMTTARGHGDCRDLIQHRFSLQVLTVVVRSLVAFPQDLFEA
ncbi:hypothetical protein PG994_014361 [Apiospora phragmitis]|uniref:Uncharacterized protein n=1 Tax=Apiospora phragmitis TaxID=2905665 RepID=A0ABR1T454_9PEZI